MARPRSRLLDLERDDMFYGTYHSAIRAIVVWPIFLAATLLLHLAAPFPHAAAVCAALCGAYYLLLDRRAGALAALICFLCWAGGGALAARLGFSPGRKKRVPPAVDNLVQAFLMVPFFALLEVFQTFAGDEPNPGFDATASNLTQEARKEWEDKKAKKMT
ncbi:uncharacterized protein LOC133921898 [Phragmites australis]|uniref:uncharacterized protein LOC133921898 n=1 Tax=Phragmites australis TaxID=29695 RepID=UPI002D769993|nr:uncharacterized protein LOC133921898 [Phragmites australis]